MTITQAKALRVGQRLTYIGQDNTTWGAVVLAKTKGGIQIRCDLDNSEGFFAWPYCWPFHILAN